MTRRAKIEHASGFTVLLVDDNADYLQATRLLLEREGHRVLTATNGPEALALLPRQPVDLLLLDYFMPGMTGEHVVAELRKFDPFIQVILQTGYASEQPPRELLQRLNIQGYYDKTEGPEQLLLWTTVGLKAAATTQLLLRSRRVLGFMAESASQLQGAAMVGEAGPEMLVRISALSALLFDGAAAHALLVTLDAALELHVRAGTGPFATVGVLREVCEPGVVAAIEAALRADEEPQLSCTVLPLVVNGQTLGAVYLDRPVLESHARDAFAVLAQQIALAIYSARLAALATVDLLTGVQTRSTFDRSFLREVRAAFRLGRGIALALIDVGGLLAGNARAGQPSGDRVLQGAAATLVTVSRAEDLVGRYDAAVFAVILRNSAPDGAARLAERLGAELRAALPSGAACVGYASAPPQPFSATDLSRAVLPSYFESIAELLRATAAAALGEAQRAGAGVVRGGVPVNWPTL